MSDRIFVATRKGLFELRRSQGRWRIAQTSFLGDSVSLVAKSPADGTLYAALNLGHFGVKLRASSDGGQRWDELSAPAFPKQPDGLEEKLPDGKPWPWRVEQIWALEVVDGTLWCGTVGGGLFRSRDPGQSWELCRGLWEHPLRMQWFGGGTDLPGIHSICPHPKNANELVVGVSCGVVSRTRDGGRSWEVLREGLPQEHAYDLTLRHALDGDATGERLAFGSTTGSLWVSENGGDSWMHLSAHLPPVYAVRFA